MGDILGHELGDLGAKAAALTPEGTWSGGLGDFSLGPTQTVIRASGHVVRKGGGSNTKAYLQDDAWTRARQTPGDPSSGEGAQPKKTDLSCLQS